MNVSTAHRTPTRTNGVVDLLIWQVSRSQLAKLAVAVLLVLLLPLTLNPYLMQLLETVLIYYIAMLGLGLLTGYSGQVSLGHGAFFAVGAYSSALLGAKAGWPFGVTSLVGIALSVLLGVILALPTLRAKGFYLAVITLAFGYIVAVLLSRLSDLTNGPTGLEVPRPALIQSEPVFLYVLAAVTIACVLFSRNLHRSHWGRGFKALESSPIAAASVGLNVYRWKVAAFMISAAFAGLAGSLYSYKVQYINSSMFGVELGIIFLVGCLVGGAGKLFGPLVGAAVIILLPQVFAPLYDYHILFYGLIMILIIVFMPLGILGSLRTPWHGRHADGDDDSAPRNTPHADIAPSDRTPLVDVRALTKRFGGIRALNDLSIAMEPGRIYSVIGPNGSGKTTLINVLTGVLRADEGSVRYAGRDLAGLSVHERARAGVARTFQNTELFGELTVLDNVLIGYYRHLKTNFWSNLLWTKRAAEEERRFRAKAMALLSRVGIARLAHEQIGDLDHGHRRLTELARALAAEPALLLLDEPASGLGAAEIEQMSRVVRTARDEGVTVLLVEHRQEVVAGLSDHVFVLDYGRKIAEGLPAEIRENKQVVEAYLGVEGETRSKRSADAGAARRPLLAVRDLFARYDHVDVLHGVNLEVREGEIVALIGANGAGKTSTLRAINNLAQVAHGHVVFEGREITGRAASEIVRRGLALVAEGHQVLGEHNVIDNLLLGAYTHRSRGDEVRQLVEQQFQLFPVLRERRLQRAGTLSGGEQQMLVIARGLMAKPKLLCVDEPSQGLAPKVVTHIMDTLVELNARGLAVLLVEQMASLALQIADRAYVLDNGRVVAEGTGAELLGSTTVRKAYLGAVT